MITTSGGSRDNYKITRRDNNPNVNLYNYKLIINRGFSRQEVAQGSYYYKNYRGIINCRETSGDYKFDNNHTGTAPGTNQKIFKKLKATRRDIRSLPDRKLLGGIERLNIRERRLKLNILLYLGEIERRGLHLPMGYSSLFDFCTGRLGYTRAAAWRRVASARIINKHPVLAVMLLEGRTSLSVVAMVSKIINNTNCGDIINIINNKSYREAERLLSVYRPVPKVRDRIKVISVLEEELTESDKYVCEEPGLSKNSARSGAGCDAGAGSNPGLNNSSDVEPGEKSVNYQDNNDSINLCDVGTGSGNNNKSGSDVEPGKKSVGELINNSDSNSRGDTGKGINNKPGKKIVLKNKYELRFMADPEFMDKLNKIKSLLSNKFPAGITLEELFDITMEEYLEKHDPERKIIRRKNRENKIKSKTGENNKNGGNNSPDNNYKSEKSSNSCNDARRTKSAGGNKKSADNINNSIDLSPQSQQQNSRYIPQAVRDEVYARDGGRCTFVGKKGKRCNCTHDLEFDHIVPFATGGDNSPDNLRLLCRRHNKLEAERAYGREFMQKHYKRE